MSFATSPYARRRAPRSGVLAPALLVAIAGSAFANVATPGPSATAGNMAEARDDGAAPSRDGGPLPIEVALSLRGHNGRSPINLSPDGEWLAHTIRSADRVEHGASFAFADTGFPFAEGDSRMEATLTSLPTGETILLGSPEASSWAPSWWPDGARMAFYSDAGGTAGLWVWERATRTAHRVGDAIVRPFFGFEAPRWDGAGERLLVKLLPEGADLAEANALLSRPRRGSRPTEAPEAHTDEPDVTVRLSSAATPPPSVTPPTNEPDAASSAEDPLERRRRGMGA